MQTFHYFIVFRQIYSVYNFEIPVYNPSGSLSNGDNRSMGLMYSFCSSSGHRDAVVLGDYFFLEKSFIFRFNLFIQLINYVSRFIGSWHSSSRVMILGLTFLLSQYFLPYIMIQFNLKINQLLIIDRLRSAEKYVRWLFPSYGMK